MRYARYPIVLAACCIVILFSVSNALSQTKYGSSTARTPSQASPDRSAAVRMQIQSIEDNIRQMREDLRPLQTQLNTAVSRQNSLKSAKPMSPQGNDRKAWQSYDNAANKWQRQLSQSQGEVNRIQQMISERQAAIESRERELQQVKMDAGLVPRDEGFESPPSSIRLPGSTVPGDPRGTLDD